MKTIKEYIQKKHIENKDISSLFISADEINEKNHKEYIKLYWGALWSYRKAIKISDLLQLDSIEFINELKKMHDDKYVNVMMPDMDSFSSYEGCKINLQTCTVKKSLLGAAPKSKDTVILYNKIMNFFGAE